MNHLGNAIRLAETAAECGADAVKFQLHDALAESTKDAPSPPYSQHETRWEYLNRTAFTDDEWATLREMCDRAGVEFLCDPDSVIGVPPQQGDREAVGRARIELGVLRLVRGGHLCLLYRLVGHTLNPCANASLSVC